MCGPRGAPVRSGTYGPTNLAPFLAALDGHFERQIVVEMTERHPLAAPPGFGEPSTASTDLPDPLTSKQPSWPPRSAMTCTSSDSRGQRYGTNCPAWGASLSFAAVLALAPNTTQISAYMDKTADLVRQLVTLWWDRAY